MQCQFQAERMILCKSLVFVELFGRVRFDRLLCRAFLVSRRTPITTVLVDEFDAGTLSLSTKSLLACWRIGALM